MAYYGIPTITPAAQAQKIRRVMRRLGINPNGKVHVRKGDYSTSIELFVYGSDGALLEDALRAIDSEMQWPIDW